MISQLVAALIVALVTFVPGVLASFALLHGVKLGRLEKLLFGFVLGLVIAPVMAVIEFALLRLHYNAGLFVFNSAVAAGAALALMHKQKQLRKLDSLSLSSVLPKIVLTPKNVEGWVKRNWVVCLLVALLATGFYVRFATAWATNFFEFDPYYYDKVTERLVQNGFIPLFTPESYYPKEGFMRWAPIVHYLTGGWYMLYENVLGAAYSKDALILTAQLYAPLVGALLSFIAFLVIKEEYNEYVALIPAALFAFTPQLLKKLSAGVNEQQPWGIFAAVMLLAVYVLAVNRKSYRLALLAAIAAAASMLGSQQYIWPFLVVAGYTALQAVLDYLAGETDDKLLKINAIIVAGALASNALMTAFQEGAYTPFPQSGVLLWVAALAFSAAFHALTRFVPAKTFKERALWTGALAVLCVIAFLFTPLASSASHYVSAATTGYAKASSALGKTIQEEGTTSAAMFEGSFGVFSGAFEPSNVLKLAALLSVATAVIALWARKKRNAALAFAAVVAVIVLLNAQVDSVLEWLAAGTGNEAAASAVSFFSSNDVLLYMLVALASTMISYLASGKKNRSAVLFVLVFFPVAYIGLNKLKYMLHLAVALCLAVGYVLGETLRALESGSELFGAADKKAIASYATAGLFLIGLVFVALQARTVGASMNELSQTRMTSDWVEAYAWMRDNTPKESRVMSWWDYGHWTTFFGERNTVLDPNNAFGEFDQGVARSFVNGNVNDLYSRMAYHDATHVLVDADLVGKWGALVFLSGSCDSTLSPVCQQSPEIDWRAGPGSSKYEAEHYYEYLTLVGKCPLSVSPVSLDALQSSFGAVYCAAEDEYFLLTQTGVLKEDYARKYKVAGVDEITRLEGDVSYLFPVSQNQFVNVNPDLSFAGINNNAFNAAFTRLFFFETLPGFKLVHASPQGQVKIFEYLGAPAVLNEAPSNLLNPETLASPEPTESSAEASAEPSVAASAEASEAATPAPN